MHLLYQHLLHLSLLNTLAYFVIYLCAMPDLPIGSTQGLKIQGASDQGVYYFLHCYWNFTLMLSQRTVLSKQPFSNFPYTVALHFRILQNYKHPLSSSPLYSNGLNTLPSSSSPEIDKLESLTLYQLLKAIPGVIAKTNSKKVTPKQLITIQLPKLDVKVCNYTITTLNL